MQGGDRQAWAFANPTDADIAALIGVGGGELHGAPFLGVRGLMLAILEDAIRAYLGPETSSREEAAFWIAESRHRWVFSFPVVCETLGLEPGAVRAALYRMRARSAPTRSRGLPNRSRPNARRQGIRIAPPVGAFDRDDAA